MTRWESRFGGRLRDVGLKSVRTNILALALLATLIPALATGWISYRQNRRANRAKLAERLSGLSTQGAREMDLWVKEGLYNLKVFAASYEVADNIERATPQTRARLADYLGSVKERFPDYDELLVVAPDGRTLASSERLSVRLHFTGDWLQQARSGDAVLGNPQHADSAAPATMEVAVPIVGTTGRFLGVMAARLNFRGVEESLRGLLAGRQGHIGVVDAEGRRFVATAERRGAMRAATLQRLIAAGGAAVTYDASDGQGVVGALTPVPRTTWSVIADIPQASAFAEITRLRNTTVILTLVLLVGVGSLAYALALLIVRPLGRLSRAADRVAGGDLEVEVPVAGGGELSQLTQVFNDMVRRLRQGREELERLSVTDELTGLANRRRLAAELEREWKRSERHKRLFVVIMMDVDRFKHFNDTYGHPAGDGVLRRLADVLREVVREVDTAARYGGEEFTVILPETPAAEGARVAERIRARMAEERFSPNGTGDAVGVTLSIGFAVFPADADSPETLISTADQALYRAKEGGRNRVVAASAAVSPTPPEAPARKTRR